MLAEPTILLAVVPGDTMVATVPLQCQDLPEDTAVVALVAVMPEEVLVTPKEVRTPPLIRAGEAVVLLVS